MTTPAEIREFPFEAAQVGLERFSTTNPYGSLVAPDGRIWKVEKDRSLAGSSRFTPGEFRKLSVQVASTGIGFATGKSGRLGYNVRATAPRDYIRRAIPFVVAVEGEESSDLAVYVVRPSNAHRPIR